MLILKHFEHFNLVFDDMAVKHFYLSVKNGCMLLFWIERMIVMEFVFLIMSWENVYVRQRKNKNMNLHLELLVSRQIDCERKAWSKNRWECDLTLWVND